MREVLPYHAQRTTTDSHVGCCAYEVQPGRARDDRAPRSLSWVPTRLADGFGPERQPCDGDCRCFTPLRGSPARIVVRLGAKWALHRWIPCPSSPSYRSHAE